MKKFRVFVDTNVFIYALDSQDTGKQQRASLVLGPLGSQATISVQVLQEFYSVATRKLGFSSVSAGRIIAEMATLNVVSPTPRHVIDAIDTHARYGLQFWDALILEAAVSANCETLLTEDLQHGQVIRGVRIVNPFL